jgi:hypothetical protein
MATTPKTIQDLIRPLKLDDSLLFISLLLAVSRQEASEPRLAQLLSQSPAAAPRFVCQFIAKQILLHSSQLGPYVLDWPRFRQLVDAYFDIDDPISSDPSWKDADPTGFFERFLGLQLASQQHRPLQEIGLALALFRDADTNLRSEIEAQLGMNIEDFMRFGFLCRAVRAAPTHCPGTINFDYLTKAYQEGITQSVPEVWQPFFKRVACTQSAFRDVCARPEYAVPDDRYATSEFNSLWRYPLCEVQTGRFVAPDAELITERTTWGLFYDMFERFGVNFATRFGDVFAQMAGNLLKSIFVPDTLWSAEAFVARTPESQRPKCKFCDWACKCGSITVLIECKSLRPSLELTTTGTHEAVEKTAKRIASALDQLIDHDASIQRGEWRQHGLDPGPTIHLVLTYGRVRTINGHFFRNRIRKALEAIGKTSNAFLVLSLKEFDSVISLVEQGERFEDIVITLAAADSFDVLQKYQPQLQTMAISRFTFDRGVQLMDSIGPKGHAS